MPELPKFEKNLESKSKNEYNNKKEEENQNSKMNNLLRQTVN